ncbi:DUF6660 family protein [Daejeonella sp.]|uniref:DUF6660 family protein n=1 Tax=Daejeonella sp. TaxID=2805397 RepID=UPI003983C127
MKFISMILLVQVLLLSSVSCADAIEYSSQDTVVETLVSPAADCTGDICSPFCSCACCIGCAYPIVAKSHPGKPALSDYSNYYIEPSYHSITRPLFQPPKA